MADHTPRDVHEAAIWDYLQRHPKVTYAEIEQATTASAFMRRRYLSKLRGDGILKRAGTNPLGKRLYTIFDYQEQADMTADKRSTPEGRIWTAIRMIKRNFSPLDIEATLRSNDNPVPLTEIQSYCTMLAGADYLKVVRKSRHNTTPAFYQLTHNTGPLPPRKKRVQAVIDQNLDRVVFVGGERV